MKIKIGQPNPLTLSVFVSTATGSELLNVSYQVIDDAGDVLDTAPVAGAQAVNISGDKYRVDVELNLDPTEDWGDNTATLLLTANYEGVDYTTQVPIEICVADAGGVLDDPNIIVQFVGEDATFNVPVVAEAGTNPLTTNSPVTIKATDACGQDFPIQSSNLVTEIDGVAYSGADLSVLPASVEPYMLTYTGADGTLVIKQVYRLGVSSVRLMKDLTSWASIISINPNFLRTQLILMAMVDGKNLFNLKGKPTSFSLTEATGIFYGFWLTASKVKLLELMWGSSGASSFEFSGHDVNLSHDPKEYLSELLSGLREELSEPMEEFKNRLYKRKITLGTGGQSCILNLSSTGNPIGVVGLSPSALGGSSSGALTIQNTHGTRARTFFSQGGKGKCH